MRVIDTRTGYSNGIDVGCQYRSPLRHPARISKELELLQRWIYRRPPVCILLSGHGWCVECYIVRFWNLNPKTVKPIGNQKFLDHRKTNLPGKPWIGRRGDIAQPGGTCWSLSPTHGANHNRSMAASTKRPWYWRIDLRDLWMNKVDGGRKIPENPRRAAHHEHDRTSESDHFFSILSAIAIGHNPQSWRISRYIF